MFDNCCKYKCPQRVNNELPRWFDIYGQVQHNKYQNYAQFLIGLKGELIFCQ